ncbi:hypothetical protein [Ferruginibacter sp.]
MEQPRYLLHEQIDKKKWDDRIATAANGLVYACSGYLDAMAGQWDALVLNDYEIVMPLTSRKKMGIRYLFQPSITPALGVFGDNISVAMIRDFLNAIPRKFKVQDISFNSSNQLSGNRGTIIPRSNYILALSGEYAFVQQGYSENIQRNITRAVKAGCTVSKDVSFEQVATICKKEFPKFTTVENGLFEKLEMVYDTFRQQSETYGVYSKEGMLLASCIFLFFKNRAYYWLVGNAVESKQFGASSLLVDSFIKDHAGKDLVLDFEGSDTPSVADFYKKFGSTPEPYSSLYINDLPFPISLLKPLPEYYRRLISK